jgi:hypothetical protein
MVNLFAKAAAVEFMTDSKSPQLAIVETEIIVGE